MKSSLTNTELVKKVRHWVYKLCHSNGRAWVLRIPADRNEDPDLLIVELCERFIKCDQNYTESPEGIARLHESANSLAKRICELREAVDADNEPSQAMATASIKREVERCRKLLGEIEAEYLPPEAKYGFPCEICQANNFNDAGNKCKGDFDCPGDRMSKVVFGKGTEG